MQSKTCLYNVYAVYQLLFIDFGSNGRFRRLRPNLDQYIRDRYQASSGDEGPRRMLVGIIDRSPGRYDPGHEQREDRGKYRLDAVDEPGLRGRDPRLPGV